MEKNSVLFAHILEQILSNGEGRGRKGQCSLRSPEPNLSVYGGRAGWERTVIFSHTYRSQILLCTVEGRGGKEQCSFLHTYIVVNWGGEE